MTPFLRAAALLCCLAPAAAAQETDGIGAEQLLPDPEFFRLATCGAPPGGECVADVRRWPKSVVTIALLPADGPEPEGFAPALDEALDNAIAEINRAGSGLRLRRTDRSTADIRVIPTIRVEGTVMVDEPGISAPGIMGVGYMTFWANGRQEITEATILISTTILPEDMVSVVLEEVFQTLGPCFDVEGPAYEGVSILSQSSNVTTRIIGQDARLLRWLYPRP